MHITFILYIIIYYNSNDEITSCSASLNENLLEKDPSKKSYSENKILDFKR